MRALDASLKSENLEERQREALQALLRQQGVPVRKEDWKSANVSPGPEAETKLRECVRGRLRAAGSPRAAFETAIEDLAPRSNNEVSLELIAMAANAAGEAFDLATADRTKFVSSIINEEKRARQHRRDEARAARQDAEAARKQKKTWEGSLLSPFAAAQMLAVTPSEFTRWVNEGKIPAAKINTPRRKGRKGIKHLFDPAVLKTLRTEVMRWRAGGKPPHRGRSNGQRPHQNQTPDHSLDRSGEAVDNATIARVAGLHDFAAHYRTARSIRRRFTLITGPTNSGKTHEALNRLAQAESGIALGPLRLLAWEMREALADRGIQASLLTGEERDIIPGSRFICATVEMCPTNMVVDVAVIDEAQLLDDTDRGHAWSAALFGVAARDVIVLGSPDCIPMVRRIAELCGDEVEEMSLARKSPLVAAREPVRVRDLERGDALIAFSRREVLELRSVLQGMGRKVACVYGALSPEVRRAEAKRFREGQADILVATDAIGLGLNIGPLRRVVFSTLMKWDGTSKRQLTVQEIKQIGGRAGRFGHQEAGGVAVLVGGGRSEHVALALAAPPGRPADLRPRVAPDSDIVHAVAEELKTTSLRATLLRIRRSVLRRDDENYRLADLTDQIEIATTLDVVKLPLLDRWTYTLCPINLRDNGINRLLIWAQRHANGQTVLPPSAGPLSRADAASEQELGKAETVYRRLVAWRWMAQRFPQAYEDIEAALRESTRLNDWIEAVLRSRPERSKRRLPTDA